MQATLSRVSKIHPPRFLVSAASHPGPTTAVVSLHCFPQVRSRIPDHIYHRGRDPACHNPSYSSPSSSFPMPLEYPRGWFLRSPVFCTIRKGSRLCKTRQSQGKINRTDLAWPSPLGCTGLTLDKPILGSWRWWTIEHLNNPSSVCLSIRTFPLSFLLQQLRLEAPPACRRPSSSTLSFN